MRVGLMADTHDRVPVIAEFVRVMQEAGVAMLIHAGDYCAPFSLRPIEEASMSLAGVFGRNDGDTQGLLACLERLAKNPELARIWGERSREKAVSLSPAVGAEAWVKVFDSLRLAQDEAGNPRRVKDLQHSQDAVI